MLKLNRSKDNRLIFQKNISSKNQIECFLDALIEIDGKKDYFEIKSLLSKNKTYRGRNEFGSISTMGVRLSEICFYMFGNKSDGMFLPSVSTDMMKKGKISEAEAMLINLYSMQFPCPYSETNLNFELYFGRLLCKLLCDVRIDKKLYIDECIWFLPFIEKIDVKIYEELIEEIKKYRMMSYLQKKELFESVKNSDEVFSNCTHELNYYFFKILKEFGVINAVQDKMHNGGTLFKFKHGKSETYRSDCICSRNKYSGYIELNEKIINKVKILEDNYSVFDKIITLQDEDMMPSDWESLLYEEYQLYFLDLIVANDVAHSNAISIVKKMIYESKNGSNDGKSFEKSLKNLWDLFREAKDVEIISGSGDTDLLCKMTINCESAKINVDAKKTKSQVSQLNSRRLTSHMKIHNSKYCIVVSPRFASGAIRDIEKSDIVTISSEALGQYCIKEVTYSNDGLVDYNALNTIIENNLGKDISMYVNEYVAEAYGYKTQ